MLVGPARQAGGIDSLESIPGLLKVLKIRALNTIQQAVKRQTCKIFYFKIYFIIAHPFYSFFYITNYMSTWSP
jgi:hypothetical protein